MIVPISILISTFSAKLSFHYHFFRYLQRINRQRYIRKIPLFYSFSISSVNISWMAWNSFNIFRPPSHITMLMKEARVVKKAKTKYKCMLIILITFQNKMFYCCIFFYRYTRNIIYRLFIQTANFIIFIKFTASVLSIPLLIRNNGHI